MTILAFSLVLLAALTHAIWNTWLKVSGDRLVALAALGMGWAIVGSFAILLLGTPDPAAWPYLGASTLVHTVYAMLLIQSYKHGNLSVAYPIARGVGPLIVVLVSAVLLGDMLSVAGLSGALLIVCGALWLGFPSSAPNYTSLLFSIATGTLIGTYTLLDGLGGRAGASPHLFAAWLFMLTSIPVIAIAWSIHRSEFTGLIRPVLAKGLAAGMLSAAAYWVVIWAMSEAHMGLVAALRESSVVFASVMGAILLKERVRWPGVAFVFVGIVLTKMG